MLTYARYMRDAGRHPSISKQGSYCTRCYRTGITRVYHMMIMMIIMYAKNTLRKILPKAGRQVCKQADLARRDGSKKATRPQTTYMCVQAQPCST